MKIGDLVIPIEASGKAARFSLMNDAFIGIVIGYDYGEPVVYWNEKFNSEIEYREQLEVIGEARR